MNSLQKLLSGGPLSGIRVLDFSRILAGPFCTQLLGDLGADVIKVERPVFGDDTRHWRPPEIDDQSCYFLSCNRNKRSICVDLKHAGGQDIARQLMKHSDVVIENFLPGYMNRIGLGYQHAVKMNPDVIYCAITGFGQTGPYVTRGGVDVIVSAVGGLMHITGPENGEPCKVGVAMTDIVTALFAKGAIVTALLHRERTGEGQFIDANLLASQVATLVNIGSNYLNVGTEAKRWGTAHASLVPYQMFPTADGNVVVGAINDKMFRLFCELIGRPDLLSDKFSTVEKRVENRTELVDSLNETFSTKPTKHWIDVFKSTTIPCGPVNSIQQVFQDPGVQHLKMHRELQGSSGIVNVVGPAVRYSNLLNEPRRAPPLLGEHTREILQEVLNWNEERVNTSLKEKHIA